MSNNFSLPGPNDLYPTPIYKNGGYTQDSRPQVKPFHDLKPEELLEVLHITIIADLDKKIKEAQLLYEEEQEDDGALGELVAYKRVREHISKFLSHAPQQTFEVSDRTKPWNQNTVWGYHP